MSRRVLAGYPGINPIPTAKSEWDQGVPVGVLRPYKVTDRFSFPPRTTCDTRKLSILPSTHDRQIQESLGQTHPLCPMFPLAHQR